MDLKLIKELMSAMERAGIKKLSVKQKGGEELHLERQEEFIKEHHYPAAAAFHPSVPREAPASPVKAAAPEEEKPGKFITAPLVGTFYAASSPDEPPLIKVGDKIHENSVVCIIEAMKVMNEVKAGLSGTVAEVFIDNAHPVEFGTRLFRIV